MIRALCVVVLVMGRGLLLTANLPQLQNLIKRDPPAYKEEFLQQWTHYNSVREIFRISPDEQAQNFRELVSFISQVSLFPISQPFTSQLYPRWPLVIPRRLRIFLRTYPVFSSRTMEASLPR
jgi:hypothetical protein